MLESRSIPRSRLFILSGSKRKTGYGLLLFSSSVSLPFRLSSLTSLTTVRLICSWHTLYAADRRSDVTGIGVSGGNRVSDTALSPQRSTPPLPDTHPRSITPHERGRLSLTSFVLSLSAISSDLVPHPSVLLRVLRG
jgi:hypothetical protein